MAINSRYFIVRTIQSLFTIWFIITFLFFVFKLMPGDFATLMLLGGAGEESIAAFREQWGLNDPIHIQYLAYLSNLLQGNFGTSIVYRKPVISFVGSAIFNSFILVAPGITIAYILGSAFGLVTGTNRGSLLEKYGIVPIILLGAIPAFFTSILLILIFSVKLGLLPTSGMISSETEALLRDSAWYEI
jgi:peptide/nickel transport system permease protein